MTNVKKFTNCFYGLILFTGAALFLGCEKVPDYCGRQQPYEPKHQFCFDGKTQNKCSDADEYNPLVEGCDPDNNNNLSTRCSGGGFAPMLGAPCDGYTLTTASAPKAGGEIEATPVITGRPVTLLATAAAGYEFACWAGASSVQERGVTLTMDKNHSIIAIFNPPSGTLATVAFTPNGTTGGTVYINSDPAEEMTTINSDATVTAMAVAADGYKFTGWAGALEGKEPTGVFTMNGGKTLVAEFTPNTYKFTVNASPLVGGVVFVNGAAAAGERDYYHGTIVTLRVQPAEGYTFTGWTGAAVGTAHPMTITMNNSYNQQTLTANFAPGTWIPEHIHTWGDWVTTKPASCTEPGVQTRVCTQDNSHTETEPIPQLSGADCAFVSVPGSQIGWTNPFTSSHVENPMNSENITLNAANRLVIAPLANPQNPNPWDLQLLQKGFNHTAISLPGIQPVYEVTITGSVTGNPVRFVMSVQGNASKDYANYAFSFNPLDGQSFTNEITVSGNFERTFTMMQGENAASDPAAELAMNLSFTGNGTLTINSFSISKAGTNTGGSIIDGGVLNYDGESYKTVIIDGKRWMAENLNYAGPNSDIGVCYNNADSNCTKYGRLYTWTEAMNISSTYNSTSWGGSDIEHQGICPVGWRLPNDDDWDNLMTAVDGSSTAGTRLKSQIGWNTGSGYIPGTNEFGFSALPGGNGWGNGNFLSAGYHGRWWSATAEYDDNYARSRYMDYHDENVYSDLDFKSNHLSARCVQGVRP